MTMKRIILIGIFSNLLLCGLLAGAETWNLSRNEYWTTVETEGSAAINDLRMKAVLRFDCNKNTSTLRFEIADYEKVQKLFDVRIFEGPSAPTRAMPLTTIDLKGVSPVQSLNLSQNGFISVMNRFVFETSSASLEQLYKRMATEGNLLRIRIKSYRDPKQFIISEFPLSNSRQAIAALAAACVDFTPQLPKPPRGK
jgi:hypothetical protein